jgi:hypothetical protein
MKKGFGFEFGSGSNSQRYGSRDPDQHKNVMDPNTAKKLSVCCDEQSPRGRGWKDFSPV